MDTILTKTASNGAEIVIMTNGLDLAASIDGRQVSDRDAWLAYPKPVTAPNGLVLGGYLRDAKIGLTVDELQTVKAGAEKAMSAARRQPVTDTRTATQKAIDRIDALEREMERADSAL